jgi:hypothetical protein
LRQRNREPIQVEPWCVRSSFDIIVTEIGNCGITSRSGREGSDLAIKFRSPLEFQFSILTTFIEGCQLLSSHRFVIVLLLTCLSFVGIPLMQSRNPTWNGTCCGATELVSLRSIFDAGVHSRRFRPLPRKHSVHWRTISCWQVGK